MLQLAVMIIDLKVRQPNISQTQFNMTISVGTQNATVGFGTGQETISICYCNKQYS